MKFSFLATMLCLTLAALLMSSCSNDEKNCPDCPAQNTAPVISALTANPEMVDQGGQVAVSATAAGTGLTYAWTATGGTFANANQASTTWTAPTAPGVHLLTVSVTKDGLTSNKSKAIGVEMSLQVTASDSSVVIGNQSIFVARAVGSNLIYDWTATNGTFTKTKEDSAWWKAPDAVPGANPEIRVVVASPGQDARIVVLPVSVVDYVPTNHPAYVGEQTCDNCHVQIAQHWVTSVHAQAYDALAAIGMQGNAECLDCHTVGSKGFQADTLNTLDNGGWDEIPIAARANVQCENCHGPGSGHTADNPDPVRLPTVLNASLCGSCHTDAHHPTYDEWQTSGHGRPPIEDAAGNAACAKCHNGAYAYKYLNNPPAFVNPDSVTQMVGIVCATCHDPHGSGLPGSLRMAAETDVSLPDGTVIPEAGAGRLCMACHNGRRTPQNIDAQIASGNAHFGPHHSNQGDMLAGTGAYEKVVQDTTHWASSRHLLVADGCVNCHTHPHEGDPDNPGNPTPNFTGHDFRPQVQSCQPCHGGITNFEDVMAGDDYDGDGTIEGVQIEIDGLMAQLQAAIIAASDTEEHRAALAADFEAGFDASPPITTEAQRKAGYNWFFVRNDGSRGVHNARYAVQLLQRSMAVLQPLPRGMAVVID